MESQEVATSGNESDTQQPQTLYVAIQPGANMESGQGDQPAVYLEVVEAGSGTEVTSSDGQVSLVQEEMVIDNGNVTALLIVAHSDAAWVQSTVKEKDGDWYIYLKVI